jgi:hypothetical protein
MERGQFLKFVLKLGEVLDFDIILILKIKYSIIDLQLLKSLSNKYQKEQPENHEFSRLESLELWLLTAFHKIFKNLNFDGILKPAVTSNHQATLCPKDFPDMVLFLYSLAHFTNPMEEPEKDHLLSASKDISSKFSVLQVFSKVLGHLSTLAKAFPSLDRTLFNSAAFEVSARLGLPLLTDMRCPKIPFPSFENPSQLIMGSPFKNEVPYSDTFLKMEKEEWDKIKKSNSLKVYELMIENLVEDVSPESLKTRKNYIDGWMQTLSLALLSNLNQNFREIFIRNKATRHPVKKITSNLTLLKTQYKKKNPKSTAELFVFDFHLQMLELKGSLSRETKEDCIAKFARSLKNVHFPGYPKLKLLLEESPFHRMSVLYLILLNFTYHFTKINLTHFKDFLEFFTQNKDVQEICILSPQCMSLLTELFHFCLSSEVTRDLIPLLNEHIAPLIIKWKTTAFKLPFVDKSILKVIIQTSQKSQSHNTGSRNKIIFIYMEYLYLYVVIENFVKIRSVNFFIKFHELLRCVLWRTLAQRSSVDPPLQRKRLPPGQIPLKASLPIRPIHRRKSRRQHCP